MVRKTNHFRILGVSFFFFIYKGLYDFYKLRELLDKDRYEIVMIGLTDEQIKNLPEGIIGIERTTSVSELAEYYSSADVFLNPTYADSFPTVNMEALACGTPVITYNTGGSPEIIDRLTGYVVEQGDIESASSIIKNMADKNTEDLLEQRRDCRLRAEQHFDKKKCFDHYIELYEGLLKK